MLSFRVHEWYQHMTHLTQHEFEILTTHSTSFSVSKKKKQKKTKKKTLQFLDQRAQNL